jgi:hypothetical protein
VKESALRLIRRMAESVAAAPPQLLSLAGADLTAGAVDHD